MIHEIEGDILLTHAPVIAHGVSPNDDFHSGLAFQLRENFPAMYKDFRHHSHAQHPKSGDLWIWSGSGPKGPVRIACLYTQGGAIGHGEKPGPAELDHVNHALKKFRKWIDQEKVSAVALPRLATGVGGLSWDKVSPLISHHLGDAKAHVFVYKTYHKGVQGKENL